MSPFITSFGGYLEQGTAGNTGNCSYCSIAETNAFLNQVSVNPNNGWRDFGIMWAYIIFNVFGAVFIYWVGRVPKGNKGRSKETGSGSGKDEKVAKDEAVVAPERETVEKDVERDQEPEQEREREREQEKEKHYSNIAGVGRDDISSSSSSEVPEDREVFVTPGEEKVLATPMLGPAHGHGPILAGKADEEEKREKEGL